MFILVSAILSLAIYRILENVTVPASFPNPIVVGPLHQDEVPCKRQQQNCHLEGSL